MASGAGEAGGGSIAVVVECLPDGGFVVESRGARFSVSGADLEDEGLMTATVDGRQAGGAVGQCCMCVYAQNLVHVVVLAFGVEMSGDDEWRASFFYRRGGSRVLLFVSTCQREGSEAYKHIAVVRRRRFWSQRIARLRKMEGWRLSVGPMHG